MKFREDNNGFVHFPIPGKIIDRIDGVKTLVYLVAFDPIDFTNKPYILSNNKLTLQGTLVSDDISIRKRQLDQSLDFEELISQQILNNEFESRYFPDGENSIPLTTSICIGWNENSFEFKDGMPWICTFRDLTHEGQKLYYSIKKLHNNKEIRILTFNNI
jgi:hypothetical protein